MSLETRATGAIWGPQRGFEEGVTDHICVSEQSAWLSGSWPSCLWAIEEMASPHTQMWSRREGGRVGACWLRPCGGHQETRTAWTAVADVTGSRRFEMKSAGREIRWEEREGRVTAEPCAPSV